MTEGSFSIAIIFDHLSDRAKAMTFPPAPANMSIKTVLVEAVTAARSPATLLLAFS
jgi:hypothetical protein